MSDNEEQQKRPPHLKYGAIISISHFQDENAFVYADGHVKHDVSLKSFALYKKAQEQTLLERQRRKKSKQQQKLQGAKSPNGQLTPGLNIPTGRAFEADDMNQNNNNVNINENPLFNDEVAEDQSPIKKQQPPRQLPKIQNVEQKMNKYQNAEGGTNFKRPSILVGERAVDSKLKEATRSRLTQNNNNGVDGRGTNYAIQQQEGGTDTPTQTIDPQVGELKASKMNVNQNKQSFSSCLFMVFPKLSNAQKAKVIKTLQYESDESAEEEDADEAEAIFENPYQTKKPNQRQKSIETQLVLKRIQTFAQPASHRLQKQGSSISGNNNNNNNHPLRTLNSRIEDSNNNDHNGKEKDNKEKDNKNKNAGEEDENEKGESDVLDRDNLEKQKIQLLNEYKANFDTFKKSKTTTVSYNTVIQLLHLNSAKWLAIKPIEARHQKENYRMTLEAYTSDDTMFKIQPAFKYQKDGDQAILASEIVYITRYHEINNRQTFLNISPEIKAMKVLSAANTQSSFQFGNGMGEVTPSAITMQQLQSKNKLKESSNDLALKTVISSSIQPIIRREINGSQEEQTNFKLNLFQENDTESSPYLKCGDVIWLHHSEVDGQIGVSRKDKGVNKFTFTSMNLKTWMSKSNLDLKVIGTSKQSMYEHYSGNTFGMWQIESQKLSDGGLVSFKQLYRLKHLSSGYFLCVQRTPKQEKIKSTDINDYFQLGLIDIPDSSTLFEFERLGGTSSSSSQSTSTSTNVKNNNSAQGSKTKGEYIALNSYVFLKNHKYKYYLDVSVDQTEIQVLGSGYSQLCTASLRTNVNEKLLFKVYCAEKNEVWEISYVISCFTYLVKLALTLENTVIENKSQEKLMFAIVRKIKKSIKAIIDLTRFCENKMYNINPQQKFGSLNMFRQKLLREQYFIDLLVKILESSLPKHELEMWMKSQDTLIQRQNSSQAGGISKRNASAAAGAAASSGRSMGQKRQGDNNEINGTNEDLLVRGGDSVIDQEEYVAYINWKVTLSKFIYTLLESICRGNTSNQIYTFDLLPFFQIHAKYIPQAASCISEICSSNEHLLLRLNENLEIQYDFSDNNYVKEDMSKTVKFLINLYDGNTRQYKERGAKNSRVEFTQHEKLTCKPINLINFFTNLLWDEQAPNKQDYMNFLSSICYFKSKGITINQENIFKLFKKFKKMSQSAGPVLAISFEDKLLQKPKKPEELSRACSQLKFYANLSFGRNYLWQQELIEQFEAENLFTFMWDSSLLQDETQSELSSALCKLAQTLYIDHEPLNRVDKPNYCRLYCDVQLISKKKESSGAIGEQQQQQQQQQQPSIWNDLPEHKVGLSTDELKKYSTLLTNLKNFLGDISTKIDEEVTFFAPQNRAQFEEGLLERDSEKPKNISGSEVLDTIMQLLNLLLELDVFTLSNRESDYSLILRSLLRILQYDRIGIKFMSALYVADKNRSQSNSSSNNASAALKNLTTGACSGIFAFVKLIMDVLQPKKKNTDEESEEGNLFEFRSNDDNMMFANPIMKGFVKLNNLMETIMYADNESIELENQIKAKVCLILDRFLSFRQDYLLTNSLCFFKKHLDSMSKQLRSRFEVQKKNESIGKHFPSSFMREENMDQSGDIIQLQGGDSTNKQKQQQQQQLSQQLDSTPQLNQKASIFKKGTVKPPLKSGATIRESMRGGDNTTTGSGAKTGRLSSFFGVGKTSKSSGSTEPIEVQIMDWWSNHFKSSKEKFILPSIALTGLSEVDKTYQDVKEIMNVLAFATGDKEESHPRFYDYVKDEKKFMPDFDLLLTQSFKKEKLDSKATPTMSALPSLMCSFLLVQDMQLEVQVLNIIMRLFNQRFELIENLGELQIIFDLNKMELFKYLRSKFLTIQSYIQKSEIWFQTLEKKQKNTTTTTNSSQAAAAANPSLFESLSPMAPPLLKMREQSIAAGKLQSIELGRAAISSAFVEKEHEAFKIFKLIESIRNGLFADITLNPNQDEFGQSITRNSTIIDVDKQKIHKYLKLHAPIITLIQDGMPHFDKILMSDSYTLSTKQLLFNLFREAFGYLRNFVERNVENQLLLSEYMHVFTTHLQYDIGQIDLICEIFRDNIDLIGRLDHELVQQFLSLIEHEGRQEKFLDFFIVIQRSREKMVFENQLLVMNSFLPMDGLTELEVKLTYTDGAKKSSSDIQFYFEDVSSMEEDQTLIKRLLEVEFRDTYLDQPFRYHAKLLNCLLYTTLQANLDIADASLNISKDHFNISVAKLKKTFSFYYLLEVLQKEDDFVGYNEYDDKDNEDIQNSNAANHNPFDQNFKNAAGLSYANQDRELRKQGFSFLKPYVADFIKIVHIFSDGQSAAETTLYSELTFTQKEFSQFIEKETARFGSVPEEELDMRYAMYVCVHILSMVAAYFDKYIRKFIDKTGSDEEERRDLVKVREFSEVVVKRMRESRKIRKTLPNYDSHFEKARNLHRLFKTDSLLNGGDMDDFNNGNNSQASMNSSNNNSEDEDDMNDVSGEMEKKRGRLESGSKVPSSILKSEGRASAIGGLLIPLQQQQPGPKKEFKIDLNSKNAAGQDKRSTMQIDSNAEQLDREYQELNWRQFVAAMTTSSFINEQVDREVKAFADAVLNVEKYIEPEYQRFIHPRLDLDLILKKFIRFLQFSLKDKDGSSKQTTLTLLKVLKTIVEKDPEDVIKRQDQMDKLGGTQMALTILSEYSNKLDGELYINFMQYLNTMLKGGNTRVQKTVYDFFTNQPKSEMIFEKFNYFIRKQIDFMEQENKVRKRSEEAKKGKFNSVNKNDLEDGISQIDDDEAAKGSGGDEESTSFSHTQDVQILDCVLDFLSLAVSGHYTEMQDYLREQHNLRSNYDLISIVADLLKQYYTDGGQKQYYESMMKCIETLIKFVQGPCPKNQLAVSDSKFFDVTHDLFERQMKPKAAADDSKSQFTTNKKSTAGGSQAAGGSRRSAQKTYSSFSRSRKSDGEDPLENWMVARLQYQSLRLVLGLLEGRSVKSDTSLIKKIARNIQVDTIEKRIVEVYTNFESIYGAEYTMKSLEHLTFNPQNPKEAENSLYKKNPDRFMHTIIQNAFLLFILFNIYMDSGERIDSQIMVVYKNQYKQLISTEKSFLMKLLTGNNIIGNLVTFFMSFIESSLKTLQTMKEDAEKQMKKLAMGSNNEEEDDAARRLRQAKLHETFKENLKKAVSFFFKNTAHIEVLRHGELETIYFMLLPYCKRLPKEKKQEFNEDVDRSNEKEKVSGLMNMSDYMLDVCRQEEELNKFFMANKFLSLFANYVELWKDVAFILTVLLNLFNLFTFTSAFGDRFYNQHFLLDQENYSVQKTEQIVSVLGLIMTCCSMFVVSFFLAKNLPLLIKRIWMSDANQKLFSTKPPLIIRMVLWLFKLIKIFLGLLQEIEIIYYICYGGFAVLGTYVHPFFFTFHLTEIFIRFPTLKSVVQAVSIPKKNLLLTYILYLIFVYLFTLFAFQYFTDYLTDECTSLVYCFTFLIDYTFKANGGIGGYITGKYDGVEKEDGTTTYDTYAFGRFFFDNLFTILVVIILVQIVAGQIIDQFGELREAENSRMDDTEGKCFICGIKSDIFDKKVDKSNRGGFVLHIKENHYMWNYVFYIGYLRYMNPDSYSGIEQYIFDMIKENDSSWFPTNRSSDLDIEEDDAKKEKALLQRIQSNTELVNQHSRDILKTLKALRNK